MSKFLAPLVAAPLGSVETERMDLRPFELDDLDGLADVSPAAKVWKFSRGHSRRVCALWCRRTDARHCRSRDLWTLGVTDASTRAARATHCSGRTHRHQIREIELRHRRGKPSRESRSCCLALVCFEASVAANLS